MYLLSSTWSSQDRNIPAPDVMNAWGARVAGQLKKRQEKNFTGENASQSSVSARYISVPPRVVALGVISKAEHAPVAFCPTCLSLQRACTVVCVFVVREAGVELVKVNKVHARGGCPLLSRLSASVALLPHWSRGKMHLDEDIVSVDLCSGSLE